MWLVIASQWEAVWRWVMTGVVEQAAFWMRQRQERKSDCSQLLPKYTTYKIVSGKEGDWERDKIGRGIKSWKMARCKLHTERPGRNSNPWRCCCKAMMLSTAPPMPSHGSHYRYAMRLKLLLAIIGFFWSWGLDKETTYYRLASTMFALLN